MTPSCRRPRSKTVATWAAVVGGAAGLHRLYLHGWRDTWAWLHLPPTLMGLAGAIRMRNLGQDDTTSWLLIPLLGLMLSMGMLNAILIGLTPDARWARQWQQPERPTGWAPVLGVILALLVGGTTLMGTVAFAGQKYFEYQRLQAERAGNPTGSPH